MSMNDGYENLDDVELFDLREPRNYSEDPYLGPRVSHIDSLFEDVFERPQVYPIEETLSTITMEEDFGPDDHFIMAIAGNFRDYTPRLEVSDFKSYHGGYVQTKEFDDTFLRIDQPQVEARPSQITTNNIRFEIPEGQPPVTHKVPGYEEVIEEADRMVFEDPTPDL